MQTKTRLVKLDVQRDDDGATYFLCSCGSKIPERDCNGERVLTGPEGWERLVLSCKCGEWICQSGYIVSGRRTVRVTFSNGDTLTTWINGTKQEILDYYVGKWFNLGTVEDDMQQAIAVEFIE